MGLGVAPADWPVLPLEPQVRLRIVRAMPSLSPAVEAEVARLWAEATRRRPLFNGRIFCADDVGPALISGHWSEYRRLIAQVAAPALAGVLRLRSLAVCGAVFGLDGLVVGRREAGSAYQAGLWQLPPAGSVDQGAATEDGADWRAALLAELREELGIVAAEVTAMRPLCLVQHPTGVLDMGVRIDVGLDGPAILARHAASGDREYDRMAVVAADQLEARVAGLGGVLVPSASVFRDHAARC